TCTSVAHTDLHSFPTRRSSDLDKGNEENLFDRVDYNVTGADSIHTNFQYTRSWFQTPNTIDNLNTDPMATDPLTGAQLPAQDQRSEEHTSELQSRFDLVCRLLL